jgi:hypothetical protein
MFPTGHRVAQILQYACTTSADLFERIEPVQLFDLAQSILAEDAGLNC